MIQKLEMFIALARERHFGRAAESLGVTQPTLSSAIRQLEETLGVQLVLRGSRFQGLTPEGARVLDRAQRIVADTRAMREEMRAVRHGLTGSLRIGVIPTALPRIATLTAPFLERNPGVHLTILSRPSAGILTGIASLDLDAGVTYLDNEPLGSLAEVPLYTETYRFLVASGSPLAARDGISWAEAAAQPLCLLTGDMQNRRILDRLLSGTPGGLVPQVEANSTIALAAHVATGLWASVVPEALAAMFAEGAALAAIPLTGARVGHAVGLVAPHREPHPPILAALMERARSVGAQRV